MTEAEFITPEPIPRLSGEPVENITVTTGNQRLDQLVAQEFNLPRAVAQRAVAAGLVLVDGKVAAKSRRPTPGSLITLIERPDETLRLLPTPAELPIIYADEHLVVVNKPVGMAAHPAPGWDGPTVNGALVAAGIELDTPGDDHRRGIVHRLDAGTTGVMVVAKTAAAARGLQADFQARRIKKIYHALVENPVKPSFGTIQTNLGRNPNSPQKMAGLTRGRPAITHYQTRGIYIPRAGKLPPLATLSLELETGRTHQIRVHASAMGNPCVADLTYGANPKVAAHFRLSRQWLHARTLGFTHPVSGEPVEVTADYSEDLLQSLEILNDTYYPG